MKKIIATVLAMVMALALCTTAFAADPVEGYTRGTGKNDTAVSENKVAFTFTAAKDPTVEDGKTTAKGNVAYYMDSTGAKYVTVATLAEADLVVYDKKGDDNKGKDVMMYLAEVDPYYYVGAAYTSFADACGHFKKPADFDSTKTYYVAEQNGAKYLYVSSDDASASNSLLVNGKLVAVLPLNATEVAHVAVPTVADGKITGYTCSKCKLAAVKAANYASIPEGAQTVGDTLYYFTAAGNDTKTDDNKNTSPKTFDAGIAMYVGMALTSVAGSAVVIGKKKEF